MFCEKEDATKAAKKKNDDLEKANRPEIDDLEVQECGTGEIADME